MSPVEGGGVLRSFQTNGCSAAGGVFSGVLRLFFVIETAFYSDLVGSGLPLGEKMSRFGRVLSEFGSGFLFRLFFFCYFSCTFLWYFLYWGNAV
jgi:hypothetical protein